MRYINPRFTYLFTYLQQQRRRTQIWKSGTVNACRDDGIWNEGPACPPRL